MSGLPSVPLSSVRFIRVMNGSTLIPWYSGLDY